MKCVQQPHRTTVVHKIYDTNHDERRNFKNSVRLDISHSKTLYVISFVSSITTVQDARFILNTKRGADKSLARPGRKQATVTEDFEFHISYL